MSCSCSASVIPARGQYFPLNSPLRAVKASTTTFSTSRLSARVQVGGRDRPLMLRPVLTRVENTYFSSNLAFLICGRITFVRTCLTGNFHDVQCTSLRLYATYAMKIQPLVLFTEYFYYQTVFYYKDTASYVQVVLCKNYVFMYLCISAGRGTRVLGYPRVHVRLASPGLHQRTPLGLAK